MPARSGIPATLATPPEDQPRPCHSPCPMPSRAPDPPCPLRGRLGQSAPARRPWRAPARPSDAKRAGAASGFPRLVGARRGVVDDEPDQRHVPDDTAIRRDVSGERIAVTALEWLQTAAVRPLRIAECLAIDAIDVDRHRHGMIRVL